MSGVESVRPALAVLVSALAAAAILRLDRQPNLREACTLVAAVVKLCLVLSLLPDALDGQPLQTTLVELLPGVALQLRADAYGAVFATVASILWLVTSVYSIGYMRALEEHAQTRYFASFALAMSAAIGVALSANLLTLYLFYEILTFATYPLVVHKESEAAIEGGRKYLAYTLGAGVLILAARAGIYTLTGTLDFRPGGIEALQGQSQWALQALFWVAIFGFGVKAALLPLHGWLPTAMIAPTPVSALLHAVAVVKSGVFGCVRVIGFVFGPQLLRQMGAASWLTYLAAATILFASLVALSQDNLKRRLAYSTISQLAYIVLGAALLTSSGMVGSVLHLANHAFLKITLFFCAGAIYVTTGCDRVSQLAGIGRRMPLTMGAFAVGALGLAGVPPLNGFISKWYLCLGSLEAMQPGMAAVLVVSGLLNIGYLFPIVYVAFFRTSENFPQRAEAPLPLLVPLVLTALASLVLGLWPDAGPQLWTLARDVSVGVQ
jgi:formate hydrogenlyase subunit 3/multisubunit Na+/H+ antiporter MnhD subunit